MIEQPSNLSTVALLTEIFIMFKNVHSITQAGRLTLFFHARFSHGSKDSENKFEKVSIDLCGSKMENAKYRQNATVIKNSGKRSYFKYKIDNRVLIESQIGLI